MEEVLAFVFGTGVAVMLFLSFSPIGRALADRLRGKAREPALDPAEFDSLRDELASVQRQLGELAERQDFTERLLGQARERGLLNPPKER